MCLLVTDQSMQAAYLLSRNKEMISEFSKFLGLD